MYKVCYIFGGLVEVDEFGLYIAKHRKERGLSQVALAEAVGISRPYLTQIENGHRVPSEKVMQSLVVALGIPMAQVVEDLLRDRMPEEQVHSLAYMVRGYDVLAKYLTSGQLREVSEAIGNLEQIDAALGVLAGNPMPPGPEGWLELSDEDRRLIQRMVNRLRTSG